VEGSGNGAHFIRNTYTSQTSGEDNVGAVYVKKGENSYIQLFMTSSGYGTNYANFDLINGTVTVESNVIGKIESISNDWYRCSIVVEATSTSNSNAVYLALITSSTSSRAESYTGDGTSGVYIFGAQLEQQSSATSLMLPTTEGSTTTRLKDEVSKSGLSSEINSVEGTLFVEASTPYNDLLFRYITISDGTDNNRVFFGFRETTGYIYYFVVLNGVVQSNFDTTTTATATSKFAVKYKENYFALWVDGVEVYSDSSGSTFPNGVLNQLHYANGDGTDRNFFGKVKQLQVFKTALDDYQLEYLTNFGKLPIWKTYTEMALALNYTIQ
jgi:hypothetical protein